MKLHERLNGIRQLMEQSHRITQGTPLANRTGYQGYPLGAQQYLVAAARRYLPRGALSLDLGCGIGAWTQFAAAAGFDSYGIDINDHLISTAERLADESRTKKYLTSESSCRFTAGNFHHGKNTDQYRLHASHGTNSKTMPLIFGKDPYNQLGISIGAAQIIYSYVWPWHAPSLCALLAKHTRPEALFVLPMYPYECRTILPLQIIEEFGAGGTALYKKAIQ